MKNQDPPHASPRKATPQPLPAAIDHLLEALVARLLLDVSDDRNESPSACGQKSEPCSYRGRDSRGGAT